MKSDEQMLSCLLQSVQANQAGMQSIMTGTLCPQLRVTLQGQLREFSALEDEAYVIAFQRGWELRELKPIRRMQIRWKFSRTGSNSRIAEQLIRHNTQELIDGLKDLHRCSRQDSPVCFLLRRLLDCETANIHQLQSYL